MDIILLMGISLDEVRHVAHLARLHLEEHELIAFQAELNELLGHFQDLNEVDVEGLEPKPHAVVMQNIWDSDEVRTGLTRDEALRNAPASKAGLFLVPTIIEE